MTDAHLLELAARFHAYPGNAEVTLRGPAVVDFARAILAEQAAEYRAALLGVAAALAGEPDGEPPRGLDAAPPGCAWVRPADGWVDLARVA